MKISNLFASLGIVIALLSIVDQRIAYADGGLAERIQDATVNVNMPKLEIYLTELTTPENFVKAVDFIFKTFSSVTMHVGNDELRFWERAPQMLGMHLKQCLKRLKII
jgi:hypothetical protein